MNPLTPFLAIPVGTGAACVAAALRPDPAVNSTRQLLVAGLSAIWALRLGTGVPMLQKTMLQSRGDKFRDYQNRVSAFFTLPPGKVVPKGKTK